jgi:glycine cleavage system aminomethyltransferase T
VRIEDVTNRWAVLGLMGPRARMLLGRIAGTADLSNEAFPFGAVRLVEIGGAEVMAIRISYVGELGWELYVPSEFAAGVLERVLDAGRDLGLRPCGMHAMDALRIEKAYRHWGHDITSEDTPIEAGLAFACAFGKNMPFIGREALLRQRETGPAKRLVQFALEDPGPLLYHNEPIWRDGKLVGLTTSANYGHTLGRAVALGYVRNGGGVVTPTFAEEGRYEIEIAGTRYPARASLRPMHDPKGERIKA